ncbi:unnamed protein product [Didymodactylos carnosus]|uniref:Uncharacterized protein n=1 Tax=Didymodactylos carnosus TaxID=1234261 RepID=A0A814QNX3_9BILA|nr:unnamed protein product [Didymodactylos carnosus]CAF3885738.1 unnamed protein product [Didymodactylos carnosus]
MNFFRSASLETLNYLHECKADRDEHLKQVMEEAQIDIDSRLILDPRENEIEEITDIDFVMDALATFVNSNTNMACPSTRKRNSNTYMETTLNLVVGSGRLSSHSDNTTNGLPLDYLIPVTRDISTESKEWQATIAEEKEKIRNNRITEHGNTVEQATRWLCFTRGSYTYSDTSASYEEIYVKQRTTTSKDRKSGRVT